MTMSVQFPMYYDVRKYIMRMILVAFLTVGALNVHQCGNSNTYEDHAATADSAESTLR